MNIIVFEQSATRHDFTISLQLDALRYLAGICHQTYHWRGTKLKNLNVSRLVLQLFCPNHWSQVFSREWRCSCSSADRRCCDYIWVINNFIAYQSAPYIRGLTIFGIWHTIRIWTSEAYHLVVKMTNTRFSCIFYIKTDEEYLRDKSTYIFMPRYLYRANVMWLHVILPSRLAGIVHHIAIKKPPIILSHLCNLPPRPRTQVSSS